MGLLAKIAAGLTAALLLTGCAGSGGGIEAYFADATPIAKQGEQKTIAVVSAIGDTFEFRTVGITVFGNNFDSAPLAAARLDEHAIAAVGKALGPQVTIKTIPVPAGTFDRYYNPPPALSGAPDAGKSQYERVHEVLKQLVAQHKADGYLMVLKGKSQFANTNINVQGIGLAQGTIANFSVLHAALEFRYYDANLELKNVKPTLRDYNPFLPPTVRAPSVAVDPSWPKTAQELAGDKRVHAAIRTLIDEGITSTLPKTITTTPAKKQRTGS